MYDEALRCAPTDTTLLVKRSFAEMMSTPPRLDLALQDANAAIQHCPTDWQGWLQKGETHLKMGEMSRAEEAFMNAIGFAKGMDKLTAQRSFADMQSRRGETSPVAGPSSTSEQSTPSPLPPEAAVHSIPPSIPTTTPSHTPSITQTSSTKNYTETTVDSASSAPNSQTSGKLTSFSCPNLTCTN